MISQIKTKPVLVPGCRIEIGQDGQILLPRCPLRPGQRLSTRPNQHVVACYRAANANFNA